MRAMTMRVLSAFAILVTAVSSVWGAGKMPSAVDVLFDANHLGEVSVGTDLVYRLEQKVSDETLLGKPMSDDIKVAIVKVTDEGKRDVNVSVFTGDHARPIQEITDLTGNPLLVVFLDRAVRSYAMVAGGKTDYLKNRFKIELGKSAKISPTKISYQGKTVDGYKVTLTPYIKDPNRHKMSGYEGSSYEIVVSDAVPGHFVELTAVLESPKEGTPRLEERITFSGMGE